MIDQTRPDQTYEINISFKVRFTFVCGTSVLSVATDYIRIFGHLGFQRALHLFSNTPLEIINSLYFNLALLQLKSQSYLQSFPLSATQMRPFMWGS